MQMRATSVCQIKLTGSTLPHGAVSSRCDCSPPPAGTKRPTGTKKTCYGGNILKTLPLLWSRPRRSQTGPSRPLPAVLPHQPLLPARLQRAPLRLLQSALARPQKPGRGRPRNAGGRTRVGGRQLQPEQPRQEPRAQQQRHTPRGSGQHVSELCRAFLSR